jgi:GNAT superfamily N-acetyltransferase
MYEIRLAKYEDVPLLPSIEKAASDLFLQYKETADLPSYLTTLDDFYEAQKNDRLWVAITPEGSPIGFALVEMYDGVAHLEEIDVYPEYGRQGIGTRLVQTVCDWARSCGIPAVTLTTFRDIPWNAPFYRRLGFRELKPEEQTAALALIVAEEEEHGLPRELRVVMRYETGPT